MRHRLILWRHCGAQPLGLIAGKRKSPSAGVIRDPFNPAVLLHTLWWGNGDILSDGQPYFGGGAEDFQSVLRVYCRCYKEFIIDSWQITMPKVWVLQGVVDSFCFADEELYQFSEEIIKRGMTL